MSAPDLRDMISHRSTGEQSRLENPERWNGTAYVPVESKHV